MPRTATREPAEVAPAPADQLGASLRLVVGRLSRQLRRRAVGGLTPGQFSALATIDRLGGVRPSELAEHEGVSAPTLSRILAGLERLGYLTRTEDPDDRRSYAVTTSPDGRRALAAIRRERTALLARGLAALDDGERAAIAAAIPPLERLVESVKQEGGR